MPRSSGIVPIQTSPECGSDVEQLAEWPDSEARAEPCMCELNLMDPFVQKEILF